MKLKFYEKLTFRITIIFLVFMICTVTLVAFATYTIQDNVYKRQMEDTVRNVSKELTDILENDGIDFVNYADYYLHHSQDMMIEYEGNYSLEVPDWRERRNRFDEAFAKEYGTKVLNEDVKFDDMPLDMQRLFAEYEFCYFMKIFADVSQRFGLAYTYLAIPETDESEPWALSYAIDPLSEERYVDGVRYRELGFVFGGGTKEGHEKIWETWDDHEDADGFEVYDNEFGNTYACYTLLKIDGKKIGIVGAEIEAERVNVDIVAITLRMVFFVSAIIIIFLAVLLYVINYRFIRRLGTVGSFVMLYAESKDPAIAADIRNTIRIRDEISMLASQFAHMIEDVDAYTERIISTQRELNEEKNRSSILERQSITDALTGIRNRSAYDLMIKDLDWDIENGDANFGIAMVDLNFLKKVNDTYGHDKGNIMIRKCCRMVCNMFEHSPVFRIGGDEFAIILKEHDLEHVEEIREQMDKQMEEWANDESLPNWERVSAAFGYAVFDPERDANADTVFKHADKAMYARKVEMKAVRE